MKVKLPVRRAILERRTYEAPAEGRFGKVRLDFNENTSGCSESGRRALAKLSAKELAMYPEHEVSTRKLAKSFGVRAEELALTNGGDDALRVFFDTFVDAGSSILICEPTFPMYRYWAEIAGARVEALRYSEKMEFPLDAVLRAMKAAPRVFFLANPNNPTGTLVAVSAIEKILKRAPRTVVVIDEAYVDFSGVSVVRLIRKYPQLFVARTFSKAAGLASLRLGAVVGAADSLALVRRAMAPFPVNLAALAATVAVVEEKKTMAKYVRDVKRLRVWFAAEMKKRGAVVYPSAGNFVLADFGAKGPQIFRALEGRGILVRERSRDIGPGVARITIGTEKELKQLLAVVDGEARRGGRG